MDTIPNAGIYISIPGRQHVRYVEGKYAFGFSVNEDDTLGLPHIWNTSDGTVVGMESDVYNITGPLE